MLVVPAPVFVVRTAVYGGKAQRTRAVKVGAFEADGDVTPGVQQLPLDNWGFEFRVLGFTGMLVYSNFIVELGLN